MRIAIIGAGFSGLAVAWYCLQRPSVKVTVFDKKGIGGGASGVAAGLLHPYAGAHAKLNRFGREGWEASSKLVQIAEDALGRPVAERKGLLRVALTDQQVSDFTLSASRYADVQLLSDVQCQALVPGIVAKGGIFIKTAMAVYPDLYLKGLWEGCQKKGAKFQLCNIYDLDELTQFDRIVLAAGSEILHLIDAAHYSLTQIKGQLLELEWPKDLPPLPFPLSSQAYLTMSPGGKTCLAGSTFEKKFAHLEVDLQVAMQAIIPKAAAFFPAIRDMPLVKGDAGVRIASKTHLPFYEKINPKTWFITGMGSKGLLYHALYAKQLVEALSAF